MKPLPKPQWRMSTNMATGCPGAIFWPAVTILRDIYPVEGAKRCVSCRFFSDIFFCACAVLTAASAWFTVADEAETRLSSVVVSSTAMSCRA